MSSIVDIKERKRVEAALQESEERFRAIFYQAAVGIAETSVKGEWLLLNDRYCEILGYTQAELRGKSFWDIVHPDDREVSLAARRQLLAGEIPSWSREKRYIRKDGATIWARVFVSLVRQQNNLPQCFIFVVEDVTEKIKAEHALRDSQRRLALAQSASRLGLWDYDVSANTTEISGEYAQLHGLPPDHPPLTHEEWLGLVHPDDRERVRALLRESFERTHIWDAEFRVVWPDGSVHWLGGKGKVFLNESCRPIRMAGISFDVTERKHNEAALRESEERFRNMADTAPVMIWMSGEDKLCTFFNKGWLDFTGRSMAQELGNGWAAGVHPDDLDRCLATYSSSFDARRSFRMEYRLRRADGEDRWVLDNGIPLYKGSEFAGYIGSCIDVTEQKLTQDRLRISERRLIDAQHLAQIGSWERHFKGDAIYWSDEMFRIFGRPIGPPPSFPVFLDYIHPDDREIVAAATHAASSSNTPVIKEFRIVREDGQVRWVRSICEAIRDDQCALVSIAGSTQDITEQVKAGELLRESEQRLKSAQRLAHVGNWHWDIEVNRIFWSEEVCRIFGRPEGYTLTYQEFLQAVQPPDRERVEQSLRDIRAGKQPHLLEFQICRPDGDVRWIACITEALRDDAGSLVGLSGACQDVTDQRRAETALRQSLHEVAHLNRVAAMGELAASLAHELNQPLAAILSNAQAANRFLSRESPDVARVRDCLTDIAADDKRAGEVIQRLRGLLRKGESLSSLVDLNEVVSDAIRLVSNDAMLRQTSVKFEPLAGLPPVRGDRIQLYQVALNLLMNGLDAVAEKPPGERWVLVRTAVADRGGVELTLEDSGKGIDESDLIRVFEPFFSTKPKGLGMGLSISQSIVQAHGGHIAAENKARGGAIFRCVLPAAQQAAARGL